jgi:hypothetical protein
MSSSSSGNLHRANPTAICAALIFEPLQVNPKRGIELCYCSRQHDGAPPRVRLHGGEPIGSGKFPDRGNVSRVCAELLFDC